MKIVKVEIFHVEFPLKEPFIISYASFYNMPAIIVKLHTDTGIVGYGESVPDEHVTGESVHSVYYALQSQLIPAVINQDPRNILNIHQVMDSALVGNGAAKAAIDIACYDILGKGSNLPVYSLLGGRKKENPTIPKVLSILEPEVLIKQAVEAREAGYKELKMKLGTDYKKDVERVRQVRKAVGRNMLIRVDVNQGWGNFQQAKRMMKQLEAYDVTWVEQPIHATDIAFFKQLKESVSMPLMADESLIDMQDLRILSEHQSVDYINIKLMKSGGIYRSYELAVQAELAGIECQIGSMVESSIASAAGFHVALARPNIISTELSGPLKFSKEPGNLTYDVPFVHIPTKPGLGIEVDQAVLEALTIHYKELSK